jgi:hypothetical protein
MPDATPARGVPRPQRKASPEDQELFNRRERRERKSFNHEIKPNLPISAFQHFSFF